MAIAGVSEPLKHPIYDSGRQLCSIYEKHVISLLSCLIMVCYTSVYSPESEISQIIIS